MIKNKNGGYRVRNNIIYVFGNVDGKRYRFSTGLEASKTNIRYIEKNYRDVLLQRVDDGKPKKLSFNLATFSHEVMNLTAHKRDKQSQKDYIYKIDTYIVPYFKSFELNDIKPMDIEKWQSILLQKYSTTTVRRIRNIFSMILKKAVGNDMISKNPIEFADNITVVHERQEPYSVEDMNKLLNGAIGWLKIFLYLAFTTGMRPGELMGLKWEDIDFEKKVIYLKRAIVKGVIKESSSTKNHNRIIIVIDSVLDMLHELLSSSKNKEWVFVSKLNKPWYEIKGIRLRYFEPLCKKVGVISKGIKATRHTYISILRNDGVDINLVLDMVGHSSKEVNDKHYYTCVINDKKIDEVNRVFQSISNDIIN